MVSGGAGEQGARAEPTGRRSKVELRARRDEAEPGNPEDE